MWENIVKFKNTIIAITTIVALAFSGNAYLAKAKDLQLLAMRVEQKIVNDQIYNLQERLYNYEDRHGCVDLQGCKDMMSPEQFKIYRLWRDQLKCLRDGRDDCA